MAGVRVGINEPEYSAEPPIEGVRIHRYSPHIGAETTVIASEAAPRHSRLANYVSCSNQHLGGIAMAVPVVIQDRPPP